MSSSRSTSTGFDVRPARTTLSLAPISSTPGAVEVGVQVAGVETDRIAGFEHDVVEQQGGSDARLARIPRSASRRTQSASTR